MRTIFFTPILWSGQARTSTPLTERLGQGVTFFQRDDLEIRHGSC